MAVGDGGIGVAVRVGVAVAVGVAVGEGDAVGLGVAVAVTVAVGVDVAVTVGWMDGDAWGVETGRVGVAISVEPPSPGRPRCI